MRASYSGSTGVSKTSCEGSIPSARANKKNVEKMDEIIVDYNRWIVALRKKQIRVIEFVLVALNMEDDL